MKDRTISLKPDLFNLQKSPYEQIKDILSTEKRTTQSICAKKTKVATSTARNNLNKLVADGVARDLGNFVINGKQTRVYEIV